MSENKQDFVWYELMTKDLNAATKFYGDVVGWTMTDAGGPGMPYMVFGMGEGTRGVGGMMQLSPEMQAGGAPQQWLGYIYAEDVDKAVEKAKAAGATLWRGPMEIPDVGRFAVMSDPQGAPFFLFKPRHRDDVPPKMAPYDVGNVGWVELGTSDWEKAWEFYQGQFGWTLSQSYDMGEPMGKYQTFSSNETEMTGGMMTVPEFMRAQMGGNARWTFYFNVDHIQRAKERLEAGGGTVTHGPAQVPGGGWILNAMDPMGTSFALLSRNG